jgi:DNA-binding NtrC family response regulator
MEQIRWSRHDERIGWKDLRTHPPARGTILVVDDDPAVRTSLQRLVAGFGHSVRAAASAEEADQWLGEGRYDVCLLDVELPRMKGLEFLSRALARDPEMAVIMMTGLDIPEVALECIDHGARNYMVKPVRAEFLQRALGDALAVRHVLVERNDLVERLG